MERRAWFVLAAICGGSLATGVAIAGVSPAALPLGDQKITTSGGKRGYVYRCGTAGGGGGAFRKGPWIDSAAGTFDLNSKAVVDGEVRWPNAAISIKARGSKLVIRSNGLPKGDPTGEFPIRASDDAYQYDRNPNSIALQSFSVSLDAKPRKRAASCLTGGPIGFAVNGVPIFDGLDAQGNDAVANEVQDRCGGHPQRQGSYHYHSISGCLPSSGVVGYALDGFPITGNIENGRSITNADLDACHGHTSTIRLRGRKLRTYHYVATREFPYTLGCFRGKPVRTGTAA